MKLYGAANTRYDDSIGWPGESSSTVCITVYASGSVVYMYSPRRFDCYAPLDILCYIVFVDFRWYGLCTWLSASNPACSRISPNSEI